LIDILISIEENLIKQTKISAHCNEIDINHSYFICRKGEMTVALSYFPKKGDIKADKYLKLKQSLDLKWILKFNLPLPKLL